MIVEIADEVSRSLNQQLNQHRSSPMQSNSQSRFSWCRSTKTFGLSLLGVVGILLSVTAVAQAQTATNADPLRDVRQTSDADNGSFGSSNTGTSGLMDLFHRAVLGLPNYAGFNQRQQESIGNEAQKFREQQRQRLQQSQPGQTQPQLQPGSGIVAPRSTPQTGNTQTSN